LEHGDGSAVGRVQAGCHNCSSSLWFYLWSVMIAVLLVVVGPVVTIAVAASGITFGAW